jgi:nucleoside-diphosphate-sugar epimerase
MPLLLLALTVSLTSAASPIVLAVGGNGFIGSYTVLSLLDAGYRVVTLNRNGSYFDAKERVNSRVESIYWDRRQRARENRALVVGDGCAGGW